MNRVTAIITAVLTIFLLFGVTYYQGRVTALKLDVAEITAVANSRQSAIAAMLIQRQQVAAIDIKYTRELADAKNEIDRLRADLANSTKRLQLNASCPKLPKATGTASIPDDASPRLTDAVERGYLRLRERIGVATNQIAGLQSYIRTQ